MFPRKTPQRGEQKLLSQVPVIRRAGLAIPIAIVDGLAFIGIVLLHAVGVLHAGMERHLGVHVPLGELHVVLHLVGHHGHTVPHLGVELLLLRVEGHVEAHGLLGEAHLGAHGEGHAHASSHHGHIRHVRHVGH
jgi:hypothetical protein